MTTPVLRIEKSINAEPARLFRAWLEAKEFPRWFFSGVELGAVELDPRPGGKFRIEMIVKGKVQPHEGEYQIIEEFSKIAFTWRSFATQHKDTLVTITFVPQTPQGQRPRTLVTLMHERLPDEPAVKGHNTGWSNILDGLDRFTSNGD